MFKRILLLTIFILLPTFASAQSPRPGSRPQDEKTRDERARDKNGLDDDQDANFPPDVRIKMAITRAENEHKKVLEDVDKLSDLSNDIAKGFDQHKQISADAMRKLGTIEKLAKHILTHAGGDEVDDKSVAADHPRLGDAIEKMNTAASNIKKEMKAETRFVVSATVIANSNEVITLSRFIRHNQKAD